MSVVSALLQALREKLDRARGEGAGSGLPPVLVAPAADEAAAPADAGYELRIERMMRAFRVDRRELEEDYTKILLDAEATCMRCRTKRRCLRELEAGTAVANAERFCPNADLMFMFGSDDERPAPYRR